MGIDKSKFGLHSLRAGGATAAVNAGVNDKLVKNMGCGVLKMQNMGMSKKI